MQRKSLKVVLVSTVVVLVGAGAAFAYWTTTGTGSGSATTGTVVPVTVTQTSTVTAMAPGLAAQPLAGKFNNPNGGPVYVTSVSATVSGTDKVGCDASDYTVTGSPAAVGAQIPAGSAQGNWSGISIAFNNKATNQDACKGALVSIAYTSN